MPTKTLEVVLDEAHIYRVNGVVKPGYSEILKSVGFPDNKFWTNAGRAEGTALHQWLLFLAQGNNPSSEPDARIAGRISGFQKFLRDHHFQFIGGEAPVYCASLGYCCTPDLWGDLDGIPTIIEAKRGAPMKRHKLQTAAQFLALEENGFNAVNRLGLYLKDGDYTQVAHDDEEDFECWKAIVSGYQAREIYK